MAPPAQPLTGVRVLDLSGPIGAYATKLLGDLGADVLLVEPPGGDALRRAAPTKEGVESPDASLLFAYYHGGKRSTVFDARDDSSLGALRALGRDADVVVISPSPRTPLAGFDARTRSVAWARQDAIVCAITPFGLTGPWRDRRATPFLSYATSGDMHRFGPPEGPPTALPGRVSWDEAGIHAAVCVVAALLARHDVGGQLVDLSVHDVLCSKDFFVESYAVGGMPPAPREIRIGYPPTGTWQCADGAVDVAAHQIAHWEAFLETLGHPEQLAAPALRDAMVRREIFDGLVEVIDELLAGECREDVVTRGQAAGLPCAAVNTPAQFADDVQLAARNFLVTIEDPVLGRVRMPGRALVTEPMLLRAGDPPPRYDPSAPARFPDTGARGAAGLARSLRDVRVLSFGAFIAGNTAGQMLAELGADVVKIEARARPEVLRMPAYSFGRIVEEPSGVTTTVLSGSLTRGLRNLSLDVHTDAGHELFLRLAERADVVIENFGSASTMSDLGFGDEELRARNPRLVTLSLSGYGRTGPRSTYRAYASNISCFVGLTHVWGSTHGTLTDYLCSAHGVLGVLAGLAHAARTGTGVVVDAAQIETAAAVLAPLLLGPLANGHDVEHTPNGAPGALLSTVVRCAGDDRWLAVELEDLDDWARLCAVLDAPHLAASTAEHAAQHRDALETALATWAADRSPHTAALLLHHAGLAAGAVHDMEDVARDPSLRARNLVVEIEQRDLGVIEHAQAPYRMVSATGALCRRSARLGEHTDEVLREWLGLGDDELDGLEQADAVFRAGFDGSRTRRS